LPYESIQARSLGLVDEISSEVVALEELRDKAGIGDNHKLIVEKRKGDFFSALFGVTTKQKPPSVSTDCSLCNTPLYLYDRTYSLFQ